MILTRTLGVLAAFSVLVLVMGTLPTLYELLSGQYVTAAAAALALVALVAGGGVLAGRRSRRWTENPYW